MTGFAFGLGVERVCARRHGVSDIREFYKNDVRFLASVLKGSPPLRGGTSAAERPTGAGAPSYDLRPLPLSMIVSFNWLKDYVAIDVPADELARRLMLAGLNHEETTAVGDDLAIDLEVTSNRPDCLGHIGVAREAAVLLGRHSCRCHCLPKAATR